MIDTRLGFNCIVVGGGGGVNIRSLRVSVFRYADCIVDRARDCTPIHLSVCVQAFKLISSKLYHSKESEEDTDPSPRIALHTASWLPNPSMHPCMVHTRNPLWINQPHRPRRTQHNNSDKSV